MPSTTGTVTHRTVATGTNRTDVQVSKNGWNDSHVFAGGAVGGLAVRDTGQADGWGWVQPVASGQVLISAGAAALPAWSASPSLTTIVATGADISGAFRNDTGIEVQNSADAGLSLFGKRTVGATTDECFFAAGMYDTASAGPFKLGSISWKWAVPTSGSAVGVLRLNASYQTSPSTTADSVSIRIFGNQGVDVFGVSDTAGPGAGIMRITGTMNVSGAVATGALSVTGNIVGTSNVLAAPTKAIGFNGRTLWNDVADGQNTWTVQDGSAGVGFDILTDAILKLRSRAISGGAALNLLEQVAPSAPGANEVVLYAVDNGSGKTQLMALFASGAAQQVAIQP